MLVSPKMIHVHKKSIEELLLDSAPSPSFDASAPGTSGRQRIAWESEVITSESDSKTLQKK